MSTIKNDVLITMQRKDTKPLEGSCHSISKLKLTLSALPYRIIDTVCGSPLRHV
ncbi:hypothetical protein SAMN05421882_100357 [Nitrosomonas communis]|uniref:Uncharacterized protein n=1 Tax=Nitrosomonas communis TaxID=44574 RepID=A0A1H2QWZ4_9PROT|nr:hypothetical protein SAMN05421882_100357 [Nitrosomonas communis]